MYKHTVRYSLIAVIMIVLFCTVFMTMAQARDVSGVTRSLPEKVSPGSDVSVTIRLNGSLPTVVGIKESLPGGYSYVRSTLPADQVTVSGSDICFAAINVTEFQYTVKAGSQVKPITGTWVDMLSKAEGSVIGAGNSSSGGSSGVAQAASDGSNQSAAAPGFMALAGLIGLTGAAIILQYGRLKR